MEIGRCGGADVVGCRSQVERAGGFSGTRVALLRCWVLLVAEKFCPAQYGQERAPVS
jgi:hypothetical protein